jgi:hypothetical protein
MGMQENAAKRPGNARMQGCKRYWAKWVRKKPGEVIEKQQQQAPASDAELASSTKPGRA